MNERIDKLISANANVSRREATKLIASGAVAVDGMVITDSAAKFEPENSVITLHSRPLAVSKFVYIMLNKPKGVVSASEAEGDVTVIDILPASFIRRGLFPAGRLDRDTTGFCLITDNGAFAHRILSPKSHVPKTYEAVLDREVDVRLVKTEFEKGIVLGDGTKLKSASFELLHGGEKPLCRVVLTQGVYHQIKLMFARLGYTVIELKRTKIGELELDNTLPDGACRYITTEELQYITKQ